MIATTRGQSNLAKAASSDPHSPHSEAKLVEPPRQTYTMTDTANIGNNSLHLMHSMQPKNKNACSRKY